MDHLPARDPETLDKSKGGYANVRETVANLLRTPAASEAERGHQDLEKIKARGGQVTLTSQIRNLPTPRASQGQQRNSQIWYRSDENMAGSNLETALYPVIDRKKMPSPAELTGFKMHWGKFDDAVRRWEKLREVPAPPPGFHVEGKKYAQLNPKFTEWMMGLPDGWITGHNVGRLEELKMCGNGVVPQQAKLALKILRDRYDRAGDKA